MGNSMCSPATPSAKPEGTISDAIGSFQLGCSAGVGFGLNAVDVRLAIAGRRSRSRAVF